jgi:tetratricopeptide (TPR) repeat protein
MPASEARLLPRLGKYEVLAPIGRGGTGAVYRARADRRGPEVAIKLLARTEAEALARFDRERRLQGALGEAEGFVPLLESGLSPEGPYLVMPLVAGGTLRERLARGPFPVEDAVALAIKLARALGRAHALGIVHRDLKPENVLFTGDGEPLVADLGLAKHFDRGVAGASLSVNLSQTGSFSGTAGYMPLEQMRDVKAAGPRADVFALGAILHECLAGAPAFSGESLVAVLARVESADRVPLERLRPEVRPWLASTVARALAHDPARRFVDANALAGALEAGEAASPRPSRRRPVALAALALALVGVAIVAVKRIAPGEPPIAAPPPAPVAPPAAAAAARGQALERSGDHAAAIAELTRALALDPHLAGALCDRAAAKFNSGDFAGAVLDGTKAIELDPGFAVAWTNRGEARWSTGDVAGAIADLSRVVELTPKNAFAWDRLGWARAMKNDREGGFRDISKAIALDPTDELAFYHRGWVREREGDHDGAIADETSAIGLDGGDLQAWIARGVSEEKKGDREAAIADFAHVTEASPGDKLAWYLLGVTRAENGDPGGAIRDLTQVLAIAPRDTAALSERAAARAKTGDAEGAIADWELYLEVLPDAADAESVRASLVELKRARGGRR